MPDSIEIEFEAALAELEQIVEALERGGPDLQEALDGYGRGVSLLGHCQGILDNAERSVALLTGIDDEGQPIRSPFDSAATASLTSTATPPPPPRSMTKKPEPNLQAASIPEAPF